MGRIKKIASERHLATASPFITAFVQQATSTPLAELPSKLDGFPQHWPFPRGDLYHWVPLLDRFDHLLELFNKEYGLDKGPQEQVFECRLLGRGDAEAGMPYPLVTVDPKELRASGYSDEGDRELVESVLHFTRVLLEHCGNRSLYSSSGHLNDLLQTTSLSLLRQCLKLSLRLAQRYHVARSKNHHPQAQAALLANHYNFDMDRLLKIAQPFPKAPSSSAGTTGTPSRGKERLLNSSFNPCDLVRIAKDPATISGKSELASVHLTYYEQSSSTSLSGSSLLLNERMPTTPTPIRRTSNLGPSRNLQSAEDRSAAANEPSATPIKSRETDDSPSPSPKIYQISATKVAETPAWDLVRSALQQVPKELAYDLLTRVRIGKAFSSSSITVQQLLEIRLLAVANLAYALREPSFHEKIGIPDWEQPKQFHLARQLCDLLRPPTEGQNVLSLDMEIAVLTTLEALSKTRHKAPEVSGTLQVTHNHGVLYFELRKVIATLHMEEHTDKKVEQHETEWREATFDLTNALLQANISARQGERMVNAGLMAVLVEALNLRTPRAERFHEKVLQFFDSFIHGISTAFETLAAIKGFDTLADLTSYEVSSSLKSAHDENGLPVDYKSRVIDYSIPFYQQSTLRQLFKFMVHMYEHNAGTHDRLLRNLIDTPQILGSLRTVIENAQIFGSNVWSGAVNILSSFINNEPTSFQVVNEAGLVLSLLQAIVPWEVKDMSDDTRSLEDMPIALDYKDGELVFPTASGILPANDTMCDILAAFGAICLNESGMKLFQASKALYKFMDIFVSPPHVRALEEDGHVASAIGQAFDELSRHHPQLKDQIIWTVVAMVKRVGEVCKYFAEHKGVGAKLWENGESGIAIAGGKKELAGISDSTVPANDEDVSNAVTAAGIGEDEKDHVDGVPFITACFKFLESFFHHTSMCAQFCEQGGAIYLLDLATSASNPYDLVAFPVFSKIASVIKTMCDAKPHLVLPSLIRRTQNALAELQPLVESNNAAGIFASFTDLSTPQAASCLPGHSGTTIVKSLAMTHILTHLLGRAFSPPSFTSRNNQVNLLFATLNFTDVYVELVRKLSSLHAALIWESLVLQKSLPETWKQPTDPKPFVMRRVDANGCVELTAEHKSQESQTNGENASASSTFCNSEKPNEGLAVKNAKTVRYLLSQAPMGIESFFHMLGQAMATTKRGNDTSSKQHAGLVADQLASKMVWEIGYKKFDSVDRLVEVRYLAQIITSTARLLVKHASSMESSYPHKEALSLVLSKFYVNDGFSRLNDSLRSFASLVAGGAAEEENAEQVIEYAREGANNILSFYNQVVRHKCIIDAVQSTVIMVKDHKQPDFFLPAQLLVEIRSTILPAVNELWGSATLMNLGEIPAKNVVEILRIILSGDGEDRGVLRRVDKAVRRTHARQPDFSMKNLQGLPTLESNGFDTKLATEALYRCNNHEAHSREYCNLRKVCSAAPSFPVPDTTQSSERPFPTDSNGTQSHKPQSVDLTDADAPNGAESDRLDYSQSSDSGGFSALIDQSMLSDVNGPEGAQSTIAEEAALASGSSSVNVSSAASTTKDSSKPFIVLEELDGQRTAVRENLIDRCLEVLSYQPNVTFELADLIQAAVARSGEGVNPRAETGSTLVSSLLSLQGEASSKDSGAKVSAYAHLVALILQDRDFFDSTLDELKDYFDALISWVQLESDQKAEDAPWIEMILLIIERVLAEDEQPVVVEWNPPTAEDALKPLPAPTVPDPVVNAVLRTSLFDALVNLLPKIGKDASLALSVTRVLVILTRNRDLALRLSDKQSMQRLFMMFRQLAGNFNDKLHSVFMVILRHMVEDKTIVRQIMETEIRRAFDISPRPIDTSTYTRTLYHLVLRDPDLFVEVTQDLLEIARLDSPLRASQMLVLKKAKPSEEETNDDSAKQPADSTAPEGSSDAQKPTEVKPPTVETTDGVIQFLLRELSNYRDVEDQPASNTTDRRPSNLNGDNADVEMADEAPTTSNAAGAADARPEQQALKAEEHIIYKYRCFVLQCLSELLASYHRTKIEFINFSRKPETQLAATPSKPRAGTLNYLLNGLLPVGSLDPTNDVNHMKRVNTSSYANSVLVSLCAKTQERQHTRSRHSPDTGAEDSDLTFVRKFVLEHALRALKDVSLSSEPLDQRCSRLASLSDMLHSMLEAESPSAHNISFIPSRQMGRLMYEKNFVTALTSATAEIDLNFPHAKRAVRSILEPLKRLMDLGVELSQDPDFSSSATGTTDEEEISSATSVSDDDEDEREQTPDLYRNSTLGMFEARGTHDEEDSESDSEGDEDEDGMFDDDYDEEMEYEEEEIAEHGEVISDEDEDLEAIEDEMGDVEGMPGDGGMVEIVMEGDEEDDSASDEVDELEDDDEDDDDEPDDFDVDQMMDEITGDDENASLNDPLDEEAWEEDDGADYIDDEGAPYRPVFPPSITNVIGGEPSGIDHGALVQIGDEEFFEDELTPDDEEDEEDDEDELVYEPDLEDDDEEGPDLQFEWEAPPPPRPGHQRHHHHHHRYPLPEMFGMIGGDTLRPYGPPAWRQHRATSTGRHGDDGTNPLLQRHGSGDGVSRDQDANVGVRLSRLTRRPIIPREIQELVNSMNHGGTHGNMSVSINPQPFSNFPPTIWSLTRPPGLLDMDRPSPRSSVYWTSDQGFPRGLDSRHHAQGTEQAADPQARLAPTTTRWQDEARMLFGGKHHEKATRIVHVLFRLLVPPAMEAKRQRDTAEAEIRAAEENAREEQRKKAEEVRLEREAREKKEQEEREAREAEERRVREEADRAAASAVDNGEQSAEQAAETSDMEGVQPSQPAENGSSTAEPEEPVERLFATIRGREVDITHLGIDRDYLEALPEEMREDVVMGQIAQHRSEETSREQPTGSGEPPTEINQDFLAALPEDLRQELLRQEARDRRRRAAQEENRRAAEAGDAQPGQPQEISNADLFAMLEGDLRVEVLRDADAGLLASLPEELQAEARNLNGHRLSHNIARLGQALGDEQTHRHRANQAAGEGNLPRRPVMQMLDKAGVATLMRLMFVSLHHKAKASLHDILSDVCKNTQGRAEVISILLSILQDGTGDVSAVERIFAHLSLRAKQFAAPKTPQPPKRTITGTVITPGAELSPLNIVQQCLGTLNVLSHDNPRVSLFFLSEHEMVTSQKNKPGKKGKGCETKANKFPLNALLTLLDRALITESIGAMETLAALLSRVTQPLNILLRRRRSAEDPEKANENGGSSAGTNAQEGANADVSMAEAANDEGAQLTASANDAAAAPTTAAAEADDQENAGGESKKKHRDLVPPEVPEENLRLVVNIISARECPGQTFSDTLDVIRNLSAIPGAKPVFGKELVRQAQELAQTVSEELEELAPQINDASTGTDLQGVALAKFASTGARQNKLLRVLVALDYLFDPKRVPQTEEPVDRSGEPQLKVDILASLYESSIFDKLWSNLSLSLAAIRNRGNMVNIAATLLPAIESLMVVCKNASLQDAPMDPVIPLAPPVVPKPGAHMEALFFSFTEENRKILNELIRNSPKLMNGNLSVMAKNSKVLEFDNKRSYFTRKLRNRGSDVRIAHHPLQLNVRRETVFTDSYKQLFYKQGDEIKYGKFNIKFKGEEGIDAGGVSREWFAAMARQMFDANYALFNPVASDRTTFHPNPFSEINPEHLSYFKFIGRIIGKALYEGRVLDCHFSRAVYRRILGKSVSLKDMESLDLDYYKSLVWILENDITDITFETFSVDVDHFGVTETYDLIENGRNIPVTQENKQEYVQKVVEHRLVKSVERQLTEFLAGFHDIIPQELIAIFNEQELELLISGLPEIDVDDWKNNTEYHNYQATSPQIQWFWRAVRSFDKEEKAKLLQFITGTSKVPLNGFKELEGMNGFARFNIHRDYSSKDKLPSSHTCFNQLDLPEYESYEHLRHQLYTAITAGSEYFGFA